MKRLKVTLLGLSRLNQHFLRAICQEPSIELAALSDDDRDRARSIADQVETKALDDHRVAIVEAARDGVDALFVDLPVFQAEEYLAIAAERSLPTLVVPPFARDFQKAKHVVDLFDAKDCPLTIARTWGEDAGAGLDADLIQSAGQICLGRGSVCTTNVAGEDWRGDLKKAGGGVLLHGGYEIIDATVQLLGMPSSVFASLGFACPSAQNRPYDSEDVASLLIQFPDGRTASINCARTCPSAEWELVLHGEQAIVSLGLGWAATSEADCEGRDHKTRQELNPMVRAVRSFARGPLIDSGGANSCLGGQLAAMAVIQTAYLSARTGEAEDPRRLIDEQSLVGR